MDLYKRLINDPAKQRFPHFMEVPASGAVSFKNSLTTAKNAHPDGASVDVRSLQEYRQSRMFMTEDKKAGYAVSPEGELHSVFSHPDSGYNNVARHAAEHGILMGGATHLSAYGENLPEMYRWGGFTPIAHTPWNEDYKPENWNEERGKPDVVFMAANPSAKKFRWEDFDKVPEGDERSVNIVKNPNHYIPGKKTRGNEEITGEDAYEGGMADAKDIGENWTQPLRDTMKGYPK